MARLKAGDVVEYHGRSVEIVEAPREVRAPSGDTVTVLRVRDPRRGLRGMFLWQLLEGLGAKPEKALVPDRDDASFA